MSSSIFDIAHHGEEREFDLTEEETHLSDLVLEVIDSSDEILDPVEVVCKSSSYTTILVRGDICDFDLMRFKFTDRTAWVSVPISKEDAEEYRHDPCFAAQRNKNQRLWKATIESPEEALQYVPFALRAFEEFKTNVGGFES